MFGNIRKSSTFAPELIERLIQNLHSLLVISFSVINYVVSTKENEDYTYQRLAYRPDFL